jgi:hypothetical protein
MKNKDKKGKKNHKGLFKIVRIKIKYRNDVQSILERRKTTIEEIEAFVDQLKLSDKIIEEPIPKVFKRTKKRIKIRKKKPNIETNFVKRKDTKKKKDLNY